MKVATTPKLTKPIRFVPVACAAVAVLLSPAAMAQPVEPGPATTGPSAAQIVPADPTTPPVEAPVVSTPRIEQYLMNAAEIQCDYMSHWQTRDRIWVACGEHGLLELQQTPAGLRAVGQRPMGGRVDSFFTAGGDLWVAVLERRAASLGRAEGSPPPSSPALPPPQPPPKSTQPPTETPPSSEELVVSAKVTAVSGLNVMINAGSDQGLFLRDRISLQLPGSLVAGGQGDHASSRAFVGRIVELWGNKARVRIGLNEQVQVGSDARLTRELPTASRVAPPRVADIWEFRAMGRPFFSLGELGGGILAEASLARRSALWRYGVHLGPVGIAAKGEQDSIAPWAGYLFGEFDSRLFAAGLGVGAQAVNVTDVEPGSGLSIVQSFRIGSIDGLHVSGRSTFVVFRSETSFSSFDMQGQFSVGEQSWFITRGGGGSPGFGFGEVALRTLLQGNGGPGSLFLEVAVGGGAFLANSCTTSVDLQFGGHPCQEQIIGGPMVGLGGEWRY